MFRIDMISTKCLSTCVNSKEIWALRRSRRLFTNIGTTSSTQLFSMNSPQMAFMKKGALKSTRKARNRRHGATNVDICWLIITPSWTISRG